MVGQGTQRLICFTKIRIFLKIQNPNLANKINNKTQNVNSYFPNQKQNDNRSASVMLQPTGKAPEDNLKVLEYNMIRV